MAKSRKPTNSESSTVPVSAEQLLKTGLVDPAKKEELERYFAARREFADLFGEGPGLKTLLNRINDAHRGVEEGRAKLRELDGKARAWASDLEKTALEPLRIILEKDPARLSDLEDMFARVRQAAERSDPEDSELSSTLRGVLEHLARVRAELDAP